MESGDLIVQESTSVIRESGLVCVRAYTCVGARTMLIRKHFLIFNCHLAVARNGSDKNQIVSLFRPS